MLGAPGKPVFWQQEVVPKTETLFSGMVIKISLNPKQRLKGKSSQFNGKKKKNNSFHPITMASLATHFYGKEGM